jgi:hypothetical protein
MVTTVEHSFAFVCLENGKTDGKRIRHFLSTNFVRYVSRSDTHFASYAGDESKHPHSTCKVRAMFTLFLQIMGHVDEFLLNFPISNFRNICSGVFEFLHVDARRCMVKLIGAFFATVRTG